MEVRTIELEAITPADYNPRLDLQPEDEQYKKIKRSIMEFGYVEPIIWNQRTGNLVSGHQRLKILKEIGKSNIKAVIVDLEMNEEKKLNLLINRVRGRWDNDKLKDLLQELNEAGGLELTGFNEVELQGIIDEYDALTDILDYEPQREEKLRIDECKTFILTIRLPQDCTVLINNYIGSNGEELAFSSIADEVVRFIEGDA